MQICGCERYSSAPARPALSVCVKGKLAVTEFNRLNKLLKHSIYGERCSPCTLAHSYASFACGLCGPHSPKPVARQARIPQSLRSEHQVTERRNILQTDNYEAVSNSGSSSSSESEDELDVLESLQDREFLRLLAKAKGMEIPSDAEQDTEPVKAKKSAKRERPVRLKDIPATVDDDDDDEDTEGNRPVAYTEDLEQSRRDFLQAAETGDRETADDLFIARRVGDAPNEGQAATQSSMQTLLDQYFGKDEDLNEDDLFLKKFMSQQGIKGEKGEEAAVSWQMQDDSEDEAHLAEADRFEAAHNFRYEEPGAGAVKTYPRVVDGIVREADTRRSESRARKKQRKEEGRAKQQAEVQRLKNVKINSIEERLQEIHKQSGMTAPPTALQKLLASADFEEEEYDKAMESIFGDEYYQEEDQKMGLDSEVDEDPDEDADDRRGVTQTGPVKVSTSKAAGKSPGASKDAAAVQELLQEYFKLDYEDVVGGVPVKFPYKKVEKVDYGLSTADILSLSDKELNQIVGLKKLAPYRTEKNARKSRFMGLHRLEVLKKSKFEGKSDAPGPEKKDVELPEIVAQAKQDRVRAQRLATYAKPQLKKSSKSTLAPTQKPLKKSSQSKPASQPAEIPVGAKMSKWQKRNMRRSRIRAQAKKD